MPREFSTIGPEKSSSYADFAVRMEKRLLKLIVLLLVLLVLGQTAMRFPALRPLLSMTDKWEGVPLIMETPSS